ncbi:hypothetical protein [Amycolatopsis sp. NPDC004378]
MIEGNGTALADNAFEDAIEATVFMATVHVREGELALPERIRGHLADGPVIVHLVRGENDVAVHEATLTSRSTLTGIVWPEDVKPRTSLTVLAPRGAAGHDIGVLLPDLPDQVPDVAEPEPVQEVVAGLLSALAEAEQPAVETELPGPAEYDVPTAPLVVTGELPAAEPTWPGDEDSEERTDLLPAVVVPDLVEDDDPRTVFSAALIAVRTPPPPKPQRGWLERRVRLLARLVLAESRTATRIALSAVSGLVLAGAGLGYAVMAVFQ